MRSLIVVIILFVSFNLSFSQFNADQILLDTVPEYFTGIGSAFYEYGEMMICVDSTNKVSILSIENYELKLYESFDNGDTWTKSSLTTGDEGNHWTAMMTCTRGGQRIIIYGINPFVNYGQSLSTMNYFKHGSFAFVETPTGWQKTTLSPVGTSNTGLIPFAIYTDANGLVHAFLHQRGWYTYGGFIHEAIYTPSTNTWSTTVQIYGYSQSIDRMTAYFARVGEDPNGDIFLIYRKQTNNLNVQELAVLMQNNNSWVSVTPTVISANYPQSYWGYDIANDITGNLFFTYTETTGPAGPRMIMCSNGFTGDTIYPFTATDTLSAVNFIERKGKEPLIQCYLKNIGKRYFEYDGQGNLIPQPEPVFADPADSVVFHDWQWIPWSAPWIANFGDKEYSFLLNKVYQGRDPLNNSKVLPMPSWFTKLTPIVLSTKAELLKFTIQGMLHSSIDTTNKEVLIVMPAGTNLSALTPDTILVSLGASVSPGEGVVQDFSGPVTYTVTAEDTAVQVQYQVTVTDNTGIEANLKRGVKVYPNPANDLINIESPVPVNIELMDINGRILVVKRDIQHVEIKLNHYNSGVYLLKIYNKSSETVKKLIIN